MKKILKETVGPGVFTQWQEVDVEICAFIDLGIKVVVNDEYTGLVYQNQIYDKYKKGQKLKAYIKCVREDGKIDVSLQPNQSSHVFLTAEKILKHLKAAGGKSRFNDKSSPEDIKNEFQVSKKVFKQAIGHLYKQFRIKITDKGIELIKD
ncbi:type I-B CRISPR-associated protein Cas8b1/Cst1 [Candidatus Uabimicrobium sp. HlEnr_7]|uniref:type I-B CRISPR-associated protein Cas8b1/Cst1 n=1 Tax=Candidatus Uabimicrobium helgolandensis TaxID=3095367 RepID=UPI0035575BC8